MRSSPDKGSTFSVLVPLAPASEPTGQGVKTATRDGGGSLAGLRVLCIDDDTSILNASSQLLERWNCEAYTAQNVAEWRHLMSEKSGFHVVLADFQLHDELNGLDILRHMRAHQAENFCGVIISAEHGEDIRREVLDAGFVFLPKPIEPSVLRNVLRETLKKINQGSEVP